MQLITPPSLSDQPITDAVITVPVYFTQSERKAVLEAAEMVNLNVLQLMSDNAAGKVLYSSGLYSKRICFKTRQYVHMLYKNFFAQLYKRWNLSLWSSCVIYVTCAWQSFVWFCQGVNTFLGPWHRRCRSPIVITLSVCLSTLCCNAITQKCLNIQTSFLIHR